MSASKAHNSRSHCGDLQSGGRGDHLWAFQPHCCCYCCHCPSAHGFVAISVALWLLSWLDYFSSPLALLVEPPPPSGPRVLLVLVVRLMHNDSLCSSNLQLFKRISRITTIGEREKRKATMIQNSLNINDTDKNYQIMNLDTGKPMWLLRVVVLKDFSTEVCRKINKREHLLCILVLNGWQHIPSMVSCPYMLRLFTIRTYKVCSILLYYATLITSLRLWLRQTQTAVVIPLATMVTGYHRLIIIVRHPTDTVQFAPCLQSLLKQEAHKSISDEIPIKFSLHGNQ